MVRFHEVKCSDEVANLFDLLEDIVEPPETESCLQLGNGSESVQELLSRSQGNVGLGGSGLCDHSTLIVRWHQVGQEFLKKTENSLLTEAPVHNIYMHMYTRTMSHCLNNAHCVLLAF